MRTFGQYLQSHREALHLSQEKMAELIGGTRDSISKYENDKTMPTIEKLCLIRRVYGVPHEEILQAAEQRFITEPLQKKIRDRKLTSLMDDPDIPDDDKQDILRILQKEKGKTNA